MADKTKIKYSDFLADRVKQRLSDCGHIELKHMMGGLVFMVDHKMCVGVDKDRKTGEDRLMVRVGKEAYDKLLLEKGSSEMNFTGKAMRGFLFISPEGFDNDKDLDFWIRKALEFNKIAPAVSKKKSKKE